MARTRDRERPDDAAAQAAGFVAELRRNVDRVDVGLVSGDAFDARRAALWTAVAAAGPEVEARVLRVLTADLAASR